MQTLVPSIIAVALLLSPILAHADKASAADCIVGTETLALKDDATGRDVTSELWFEAPQHAKLEWFSARPALRPVPIARHVSPRYPDQKRALIVISPGNWGSRYSQGWLALELVKSGYVVLSTSHPGTAADDQTLAGRHRLWERSRDVSFALSEVLRHPTWAGLVDGNRVGFVGHSFGGWTGVSLAGGRYDPVRQRLFCAAAVVKDFYCAELLKDDAAAVPVADAGNSFADSRIKAFYIMGSGPGQGFTSVSLKSIRVPFLVDTAQFDDILEPRSNSTRLAREIAGAREIMRPVGHFTYIPECRWLVGPLLARLTGFPACDDPPGVDRNLVHKQLATDVVAFFAKALAVRE